jgi:ribosomal protein L23
MIKRFVITEKTLHLAEKENKKTVIVDRTATKKQIADEIRRLYGVFSTWVRLHLFEFKTVITLTVGCLSLIFLLP